jgi:hypothetical protein
MNGVLDFERIDTVSTNWMKRVIDSFYLHLKDKTIKYSVEFSIFLVTPPSAFKSFSAYSCPGCLNVTSFKNTCKMASVKGDIFEIIIIIIIIIIILIIMYRVGTGWSVVYAGK